MGAIVRGGELLSRGELSLNRKTHMSAEAATRSVL